MLWQIGVHKRNDRQISTQIHLSDLQQILIILIF